ncbi:benzyl alcohol O-benzoyltransferase [Hibiscus syriacus]|uniref:Benzyl alcohol O-benzoyltransferase n=1 Tax=Hibiscus syriacus TaxID=106335 RepID=A0A6A2XPR3_HIBSY|nr:benzyl alcohol O-benzoyltransferase [Hibiscus syriacus]
MAGLIMMFPKMVKAAISFPGNMFWKSVLWTVALVSLPYRMLTALQREKLLEQHLQEMQFEFETLVWDRKDLEEHLQAAARESRIMESVLIELEGEHNKAVARIELLEGEWISLQELMMNREAWEGKSKSNFGTFNLLKAAPAPSGSVELFTPSVQNPDVNTVIEERRDIALSQTLFSAILSLLVGMIVWEAEDPCMPLVVALFTVVGMSLKSVVQFFFTIKNKPASDAVALLSFNWFVVGTLSYPALPKVTRLLATVTLSLVNRVASWLGISFN